MKVKVILKSDDVIVWEYIDNPFTLKHQKLLSYCLDNEFKWTEGLGGFPQPIKEWDIILLNHF